MNKVSGSQTKFPAKSWNFKQGKTSEFLGMHNSFGTEITFPFASSNDTKVAEGTLDRAEEGKTTSTSSTVRKVMKGGGGA